MLPFLWLLTNNAVVLAEETSLVQEDLITESETTNENTKDLFDEITGHSVEEEATEYPDDIVVENLDIQEDTTEEIDFLEISVSENLEDENVVQVVEEDIVETDQLEHTIEANAPPSSFEEDDGVELDNDLASQDDSIEAEQDTEQDIENDNDKIDPEIIKSTDSLVTDDLVAIIVETNTQPALDRAVYRDRKAFEQAVENASQDVNNQYLTIKNQLAERGYDLVARHQYSASFTGFSAEVPRWVAEEIKSFPQVLSVSEQQWIEAPVDQPSMHSSPYMIDLIKMYEQDLPYKGAGMVVAVIDTGIDPDHPDFVLDDDVEIRYTEDEMNRKIEELGLKGRWYSNKIPYGYNYIDQVQTVKDRNEHGIHVAGTIGANGNPETGGIRGVAPHVQILAMKAFSNDPNFAGVFEDTWMKALDDSIKLGADVINMSLGGTAGFSLGGSKPSASAFKLARSKGIIIAVANGNDRNQTYGNEWTPHKDNPDSLMTGSPALIDESFAVASVDNIKQMVSYVEVTYGDGQVERFEGISVDSSLYTKDAYPLIEAGLGREQDYQAINSLSDHYVIVQRGETTFADKYAEAIKRGAKGILVYDNVDSESILRMGGIEQPQVPMIMIHKQSGERILELQEVYDNVQVRIPKEMMQKDSPTANNVSEFSSWGPTNDLRLKPDIAAPGGNIYSLMSDGRYQDMSGTSMATPHIAGISALVMERLIKEGYITEQTMHLKDDLAILMLMNTATPLKNTIGENKYYYSPIQQGAGLVNVYNAITNEVIVTAVGERDTKQDGKLELGDNIGAFFEFELTLYNLGKEERTYNVEAELIKDLYDENNRYTEETTFAQVTWLGQVVVKPGETVSYRFK